MKYQTLSLKWRPQSFEDLVDQYHVRKALENSLRNKKLHHSYLFYGMHGVGKTTIARLLSKGLNCKIDITAFPCNQCTNCKAIEQNKFVDLIEIDAASRTKVENILELLDGVKYLPTEGRFKIYLLDEVHMLSRYSFNALLKILEEPPLHIKFILATTDLQKLPMTIISRCIKFNLKPLGIEKIYKKLIKIVKKEKISSELKALYLISYASNGSMRDALSLTDQAIAIGNSKITEHLVQEMLGVLNIEKSLVLIEFLIKNDIKNLMYKIDQYSNLGLSWNNLLSDILYLINRISIGKFLPSIFNEKETINISKRLFKLSKYLSIKEIQCLYEIILKGKKELSYTPNLKMGVEMIFIRAIDFLNKIQ